MSIKQGWNFFIERSVHAGSLAIYIIYYGNGIRECLTTEDGKAVMTAISEEQAVKPFVTIPLWDAEDFLKSLATAVDEHGIKPESQSKLEGILEATRDHLADMRKLVPGLKD